MARLLTIFLALARRDTNVLRAARLLSTLLVFFGVGWLFLLPLDGYNRHTYHSENALLPGQVHTYFGGSEHEVFRAYRHEAGDIASLDPSKAAARVEEIFQSQHLKTARQPYNITWPTGHDLPSWSSTSRSIAGENAYALLQGPRADATEAMVLMASIRNMDNEINYSGVALVLTLARYFMRWSLWSKDILFVITTDSSAGPEAWVSAYHEDHDPRFIASLPLKAGAIQGAIAVDYPASPAGHRFEKLYIQYDGTNGMLPNLDLLNTVVAIANNQVAISSSIQGLHAHSDSYNDRLSAIFRSIFSQAAGQVTGPHSPFMPFHIDAITLKTVGDGWHDEMSLGMVVESTFRSINNLLEKLHQSFFFYILLHPEHFVSIASYLPSALLTAASFALMSVAHWLQSAKPMADQKAQHPSSNTGVENVRAEESKEQDIKLEYKGTTTVIPGEVLEVRERSLLRPLLLVLAAHTGGYFMFSSTQGGVAQLSAAYSWLLPMTSNTIAFILYTVMALRSFTTQEHILTLCFSQLLLGVALATLSTLNFSLGLLVGLCSAPLIFVSPSLPFSSAPVVAHPIPTNTKSSGFYLAGQIFLLFVLQLVSPISIFGIMAAVMRGSYTFAGVTGGMSDLVQQASRAYHVHDTWTAVVVWLVWWPAWAVGAIVNARHVWDLVGQITSGTSGNGVNSKAVEGKR